MFKKKFPFFRQLDTMDCGPTCLRIIAAYHGRQYSLQYLRERCYLDREGVSLRGIIEGAEQIGLRTLAVMLPFERESEEEPGLLNAPFPCIVHWQQRHFVVVYRASKKYIWIADPAIGRRKLTHAAFRKSWIETADKGIVLLLESMPEFYTYEGEKINRAGFGYLLQYLRPYRRLLVQLSIGLFLGSIFQLIFPFLTQTIVDTGIANQDLNFIYLVLLAQLMLFLGQISVNVIQSWILLHIGARINVSLISDFLVKLMRLPISFFDSKMIGDLLQRIGDHRRVEQFLTTSTLTILFSAFNMLIFGIVLWIYSTTIFLIFLIASLLYVGWIWLFMKKRAVVDHQRFKELSENQSALIELIQGMQEIKLQLSERRHRWDWMHIQARLFRANIRSLRITQLQDTGAATVSQLKDILIIFFSARLVIEGSITLGMMLAIQYIIGQLNGPLQQFIVFIRAAQDAKISLERLGEIHQREEEEYQPANTDLLPEQGDFHLNNVSFRYNELAGFALEKVSVIIPHGKVTAIVGTSGSGKTTLVKLLLGFYEPTRGSIRIGGIWLRNINKSLWRSSCGAVMQDGYIFSQSIARNIAESDDQVDKQKLWKAVKTANIHEFVESMPLGYNTMVGLRGNGLSQGQRQRLLIARAVYKDPPFLFFDEATNALDARNEKVILENLETFFSGRTVIVVAHRLSTVRHAHKIIVLEKGQLVEEGNHEDLVAKKGKYYELVRNQLELGA